MRRTRTYFDGIAETRQDLSDFETASEFTSTCFTIPQFRAQITRFIIYRFKSLIVLLPDKTFPILLSQKSNLLLVVMGVELFTNNFELTVVIAYTRDSSIENLQYQRFISKQAHNVSLTN